ncbi:MAG TPA: hypothetical protein VNG12_17000 [Acidimicrobiales bacterium]|nr:hypothetical protein [Acidimicrobiales bacterium]
MTDRSTGAGDRADHWDSAYQDRGTHGVSWFQPDPTVLTELIEMLGVSTDDAVIDVGGGTSLLVDSLIGRGWSDVAVLDISLSKRRVSDSEAMLRSLGSIRTSSPGPPSVTMASGTTGLYSIFSSMPPSAKPIFACCERRSPRAGR